VNYESYLALAKQYVRGSYDNELELGVWLAKWYSRTYGVSLKDSMDMTLDELMIEYYAAPYFKDPSLLIEEEQAAQKQAQLKADEEWSKKLSDEKKEEIDPKVKEMMAKFKPMEFGE
jgi:hypothetical protein